MRDFGGGSVKEGQIGGSLTVLSEDDIQRTLRPHLLFS